MKCPDKIHDSQLFSLGDICNNKSNPLKCEECNSFYFWCKNNNRRDLIELWDYDKNKDNINRVRFGSEKQYYFKCENGIHESELRYIFNINGIKHLCRECNSFYFWFSNNFSVDLFDNVWSTKNIVNQSRISKSYGNKILWKCPNGIHNDFFRSISNSKLCGFRCPECTLERDESILQEKVRLYLYEEYKYKLNHEYKCTIVPKNPKTKMLLPFDNEIYDIKLIIEVHGQQHYFDNAYRSKWFNKFSTPEQQLYKRKLYDRYKKFIAIISGYNYLEIPYWTEKQESYKILIDDKIKEIINIRK